MGTVSNAYHTVFQLVYHSVATRPLTETELYRLLSQARQANAAAQLTGLLVYRDGHFVQVLEGPEATVRAVYARIQQDSRHSPVVTVSEAPERPRYFAQWRMALGRVAAPAVVRVFDATLALLAGGGSRLSEALLQEVGAALKNLPG